MTPPLPLIAICQNTLDLLDGRYPLDRTNLLGLLRQSQNTCLYYDQKGQVWSCTFFSPNYKPTLLNRLLAYTLYNPQITIQRTWTPQQPYALPELKERICQCIDKDDDLLTQFIEGSCLQQKIGNCEDFNSLINTLLAYVFDPDKEEIEKEWSFQKEEKD